MGGRGTSNSSFGRWKQETGKKQGKKKGEREIRRESQDKEIRLTQDKEISAAAATRV